MRSLIETERGCLTREPFDRGDAILHRGGKLVLRREAIVEREHRRRGVVAQRAAQHVVTLDVADNAAATMNEQNRGAARAAGFRWDVSAQPHRPSRARQGEVAHLADDRCRDLGVEQHAAILVARFLGREAPQRGGRRGRRPMQ